MTGSPGAAVFYALVSAVGTWLVWSLLWREYRADLLRHRILVFRDGLSPGEFAAERQLLAALAASADRLTLTRLLLSRLATRRLEPANAPGIHPEKLAAALLPGLHRIFPSAGTWIAKAALTLARLREPLTTVNG